MPEDPASPLQSFRGKDPSFFPTYKGEERNRTSMLLALLKAIRPFSINVFAGMTSSTSSRTQVDARIEPSGLTHGPGAPDGVVSIQYGSLPAWRCLIEVKSRGELEAHQVRRYYQAAETHDLDHVLTISRAIRTSGHPSGFDPGNRRGRPGLSHLSWLEIDNAILRTLADAENGTELSRSARMLLEDFHLYLKRSSVDTVAFQSLGASFNRLRTQPAGSLSRAKNRQDARSTATAWLEVVTAEALRLTSQFNQEVLLSSPSRCEMIERALRNEGIMAATFRTRSAEMGRLIASLEIASQRLMLTWTLSLDDAVTPGTRSRRRWELINHALSRFSNGSSTVVVRGGPREVLTSGLLHRVRDEISTRSVMDRSRPSSVEVRRTVSLRGLRANTVAPRLHSSLVSFSPWQDCAN